MSSVCWFVIACIILLLAVTSEVIVNTAYGPVEGGLIYGNDPGMVFPEEIISFIGIPYAKPPIGSLRFKPPQEADIYISNPFIAHGNIESIAACPQYDGGGKGPAVQSEDCLTLSIYTPSVTDEYKYPVMIWIHGGSFTGSWGNNYQFDPQNLMIAADKKVIVVNINYRLGILGTLYDNKYNTKINGNFGFQDQVLAIKYVYENIANFGGDPQQITIFGESAGAHYIGFHLLYNNEYINGGIMQSATFGLPMKTPITWDEFPTHFSNIIGCDASILSTIDLIQCWQNADLSLIIQVQSQPLSGWKEGYYFTPTVNTKLLANDPIFEFGKKGKNKNKIPPFIIGTNKDEGYFFINDDNKETTSYHDIVDRLTQRLSNNGDAAQTVLNYYGISEISTGPTDSYLYSYAEIITDHDYKCSTHKVLKNMKINKNKDDIYHYSLEFVDTALQSIFWASWPQCITRTCHYIDIGPVFTNGRYKMYMDWFGPNTVELGGQIQKWWTNFAATSNPNGDGDNVWPIYSNPSKENKFNSLRIMEYENYIKTIINDDDELCLFWDSIGYAGSYLQHGSAPKSASFPAQISPIKPIQPMTPSNTSSSILYIMGGVIAFLLLINLWCICYGKYSPSKAIKYAEVAQITSSDDEVQNIKEYRV